MGHLYFIRHGQTVWNVENKICGKSDSPLTEKGREQAAETAAHMIEQRIAADEILCSPLSRARDTAEIISLKTGIPYRVEPRLIEQNFGKWESTPRNGADFAKAKENFAESYEGGESMLKLAQRIYNLLDEITADDKTYVLVAHNGIARVVQSYFHDMTNTEYAAWGVPNCSVTRYDFERKPNAGRDSRLIADLMERMIAFSERNHHDINHFMKVWGYARTIGIAEGLDADTQRILEAAAIVHDIACPLCRVKYGQADGRHQEIEGYPLAKNFLRDSGLAEDEIERVAYLVGHHHTISAIDGRDYQILIEADYLVNAEESGYSTENIRHTGDVVFKTQTGKQLLALL